MSLQVTEQHKLAQAQWQPSTHCEPRVVDWRPELVILHCVSLPEGKFGTGAPARLFVGDLDTTEHESFADLEGMKVAPHLFIERDGSVHQFVTFDQQAWHAGLSTWRGRSGCNEFSIGIELEGAVDQQYDPAQYESLVNVLGALLRAYPSLSVGNIVGHSDVAPGRKLDPGPLFDWASLLRDIHALVKRPL